MSNRNIEEKNETTLDLHYKNNNRKTLDVDVILIYLSDHEAGNG